MKRNHCLSDEEFQAAVTRVYDLGSDDYLERWSVPYAWQAEEWRRFTTAVRAGSKVLDVGCNAGTDLQRLVKAGYQTTGLDVSEYALRLAARRCPEAALLHMNMLDLGSLEEVFDALWVSYSMVHIPFGRMAEALSALNSVLRPGGFLMMMMTVTKEPCEKLHDSEVMFEASGRARKVPVAHWAPGPLREAFETHFNVEWEGPLEFVRDHAAYSLLVSSRCRPGEA